MSDKPALALTVALITDVVAYACGTCGAVCHTREEAEKCCGQRVCEKCGAAMSGAGRRYPTTCDACRKLADDAREQARYDAAPKLTEAEWAARTDLSSWLWYEDQGFDGIEELREHCLDDEQPFPEYVEACVDRKFALDAEEIVQDALERIEVWDDAHEAMPAAVALAELQAALDGWTAKQKIAWYEASGTLVLLDEGENARALAQWKADDAAAGGSTCAP